MKNFNGGGHKQGGGGFGGRQKFSGGGDRTGSGRGKFGGGKRDGGKFGVEHGSRPFDKELFAATCSSCKKHCEVPFRPSPDKPVYCSACFGKNGSNDARTKERGEKRSGGDVSRVSQAQREERIFKQEYVPVQKDRSGHDELKKQIAVLESKLNRVIEMLTPLPEVKKVAKEAAPAEEAPKKVRKPKTVQSKAVVKKKAVKKAAKTTRAVKKAAKTKAKK